MKTFTVQLSYAAYYFREEVVEAGTLEEALDQAVAKANDSPNWSSTDTTGNTFVDAVAEGDHYDLWADNVQQLAIPSRFSEDRGGPHIVITVAGGLIQHVDIQNGTALVEVHDYDTEGTSEPENLQRDPDGTPFLRALHSNRDEDQPDNNPAPNSAASEGSA
ncbi:MAG: hypothetical protein H0U98_04760 [Alphaproteobacteria bacterium]|nr:hypothetical protein [Alphaproteobacteria bacterium]